MAQGLVGLAMVCQASIIGKEEDVRGCAVHEGAWAVHRGDDHLASGCHSGKAAEDRFGHNAIQAASRLVQEEQGWLLEELGGDGQALLLTPG